MGILNIASAERAGAHLLIQLYGPPRSGKTYTALRIARGMVGPKGRIGVLDTESGRARLYSDSAGRVCRRGIDPPYTPRATSKRSRSSGHGVYILVAEFGRLEGPGGVPRWPTTPRRPEGPDEMVGRNAITKSWSRFRSRRACT